SGVYLIKKYMKERYPLKEMFLPLCILVSSIALGLVTAKLVFYHDTVIYFCTLIIFTLISFFTGSISISEIKKTMSDISGLK
ncbi:hypothetical protein KKB18_04745, partial [bacterium]|nr:hypothetical protein [bacterium]